MGHFVLVPGAWLDGAIFEPVCGRLRDRGHATSSLPLPGIGKRHGGVIDLDSWIDFVVTSVRAIESSDRIVIVGHSFAGLVVGRAAARLGPLVDRLVLIDTNIPVPGRSFADEWSKTGRKWLIDRVESHDGYSPPDLDPAETGLDGRARATVRSLAHPMPGARLFDPVPEAALPVEVPTTYLWCTLPRPAAPTDLAPTAAQFSWDVVPIECSHWPMASHPDILAAELAGVLPSASEPAVHRPVRLGTLEQAPWKRCEDVDMLDHLGIQCADISTSAAFYDAVLAPLGATRLMDFDVAIGYGSSKPDFWIGRLESGDGFRESHIAFTAADRATVRTFFDAAVAAGAEVLHEPKTWPEYHADYFAAFVRDPDGNNVEAVSHAPETGRPPTGA